MPRTRKLDRKVTINSLSQIDLRVKPEDQASWMELASTILLRKRFKLISSCWWSCTSKRTRVVLIDASCWIDRQTAPPNATFHCPTWKPFQIINPQMPHYSYTTRQSTTWANWIPRAKNTEGENSAPVNDAAPDLVITGLRVQLTPHSARAPKPSWFTCV